jgi:hypothetical protein
MVKVLVVPALRFFGIHKIWTYQKMSGKYAARVLKVVPEGDVVKLITGFDW